MFLANVSRNFRYLFWDTKLNCTNFKQRVLSRTTETSKPQRLPSPRKTRIPNVQKLYRILKYYILYCSNINTNFHPVWALVPAINDKTIINIYREQNVFFVSSLAFKCKYVTCDYSAWSEWSISCGKGMKRRKTLTKVNEHIIEQQGGCSGLATTCEEEKVETKDMDCK